MTQLIQSTRPNSSYDNFPLYFLSEVESFGRDSAQCYPLLTEIDHSELILSDVNTRQNVVARTLTLTDSSGTETKSIIVSAAAPDSAKFRAMSVRVLRLVTLRVPKPYMPHAHVPEYLLAYVTETLECGHTLDFFPVADPLIARRRNCPQCAAVGQKKPPQSVTALRERKAA